jgi:hypothetical protein
MAFTLPSWSNLENLVANVEAEFNTLYTVLSSVPAAAAVINKIAPEKIVTEAEGALSLAETAGQTVAEEFNPSHNPPSLPLVPPEPETPAQVTSPHA